MITRTNPTNVVLVIFPLLLRIPISEELPEEEQDQDVAFLIDLPLDQLLAQKRIFDNTTEDKSPEALPLVSRPPETGSNINQFHRLPIRKTFDEDYYEDDKDHHHVSKKKEKSKGYDILNISITALSYLAFGGYLLCMIAGALREKRRVFATYPGVGTQGNNKFTNILQQYLTHRPIRIRFPAVTLHGGRKKRRKRSETSPYGYHRRGHPTKESARDVGQGEERREEEEEEADSFSIINVIDYFEIQSRIADGGV